MRFSEALGRADLGRRARRALEAGPLCDRCLGRLFAQVDTGLTNAERGRRVREALGVPPPGGPCRLCRNLFDGLEGWSARAEAALRRLESDTFAVGSHPDCRIAEAEQALWDAVGGETAEPYKQAFNRLLGTRLAEATGREVDLVHPEVQVLAHHRTGRVTLRIEPLYLGGGYRKLVRGLPQCRWKAWPTSIQEIVGDPVLRAAEGEDHRLHGCGREDTDVRCLGRRPFVLEIRRPRRRRLDWPALVAEINATGQVEVDGLAPCPRAEVACLKALRPDKTYRAVVELEAEVDEAALARLADLVGLVRQRTPARVLRRRPDRTRRRRVVDLEWKRLGPRRVELTVRAQAGTYVKELVSGDGGRTRPSAAKVLGVEAACAELDVTAIHL